MAAVWVCASALGLRPRPFQGFSAVAELLQELEQVTGVCDFYAVCDGRVVDRDQPLHDGSVYHLEPRLRGGKGGFGSMLRALGAQIEKTTNREACRDLSGRRLRDVNHEKEMAEWLKKQAEREAEKEQRRLERLQKKLAEPKHNFTDSKYTQQCHELSERLEDSVIKGLQASSSSVLRPEASKRPSEERAGPQNKKSRSSAPFTWTGLDLSDDDTDQESEPDPDLQGPEESGCRPEGDQGQSGSDPVQSKPAESGSRPERDQGQSGSRPERDQGESGSRPERDKDQSPDQRPLLDLDSVSCSDDLEALGLNVLKEELMKRGLKCGGTLAERAARLFSVRGKREDEIDPALLVKNVKKNKKKNK